MLRDSLRESLDRRSFFIGFVISTVFILTCGTIGFEEVHPALALKSFEGRFRSLVGETGGGAFGINDRFEISDIRMVPREPGHEAFEGGWTYRLQVWPLVEFQRHVLASIAWNGGHDSKHSSRLSKNYGEVLDPPTPAELAGFLRGKLKEHNLSQSRVEFEGIGGDRVAFQVWLKPGSTAMLPGSHRMTILFGALDVDMHRQSVADVIYAIQDTLANVVAGWVGILIAIIATAGFIPNMLQKGTLDLTLSRPVPRWRILLYKYLGGLIYVSAAAGYLILGSWLILGLRSGIWSTGYLLAIPLLIFFFAALYSVSVLIGVATREKIAPILLTALAWFGLAALGHIHMFMHIPGATNLDPNGPTAKFVEGSHAVLPRLKEVGQTISWALVKTNGITPERWAVMYRETPYPEVNLAPLFGVTGAWMIGLLGISCWMFSRRDY
jgi:ABC-type transport system involved in multi-copper enzyme maturation permease subunit